VKRIYLRFASFADSWDVGSGFPVKSCEFSCVIVDTSVSRKSPEASLRSGRMQKLDENHVSLARGLAKRAGAI
jgi:hypothetical protein